jgi:hypothetical protein
MASSNSRTTRSKTKTPGGGVAASISPFIPYRDLLIWPTTDDQGKHYAEIIGVDGEDAREAADAPTFDTQEKAVAEAQRWINRHLDEVKR